MASSSTYLQPQRNKEKLCRTSSETNLIACRKYMQFKRHGGLKHTGRMQLSAM